MGETTPRNYDVNKLLHWGEVLVFAMIRTNNGFWIYQNCGYLTIMYDCEMNN